MQGSSVMWAFDPHVFMRMYLRIKSCVLIFTRDKNIKLYGR